jgi:ABC-type polysaccharide/polyol phosphate transport system ATPase subunit
MSRIELQNVELAYPIKENRSLTLKDIILYGLFRKEAKPKWNIVNALRGISLQIEDKERVGIIGHNGAGKSTLLRTVAGVYPVSRGKLSVQGHICSLFDINVGFETSATGWENIRFRGYLQGEKPASIKKKIGEIAEFSELGEFLNLPLKCYSAGMVTRLAFSIATAREPEILLIDEVFGAGDAQFVNKAVARMHDMMAKANIVVMVTHNLSILESFCSRVIWIDHGKVHMDGPMRRVIDAYNDATGQTRAAA